MRLTQKGWSLFYIGCRRVVGAFRQLHSYFLVPFGQKYLQPTTVATYNYLQPVTASLIAVAASQETFGPVKALAMLLVFLGVWFVSTSGQRKTGVAIFSLRKDRN